MTKQRSAQLGSMCVFCGSTPGTDSRYREAAEQLGQVLADEGITLVYGGGHVGLMGILAEASLKSGGRVIGIIPDHLMRVEAPFLEISELIVVDSMHARKRRMFDLADAFCVLPGGLGTMDETFEIITWKQLRLHDKPIVLANIAGHWTPWVQLIESIVVNGFAQPGVSRLYSMVDSIDQILPTVRREMTVALASESRLF